MASEINENTSIPNSGPWPMPGMVLRAEEDHESRLNACIPVKLSWTAYQEGFRRAVKVMAEHVAESNRDQDFLIYPLLFCGRQVIELGLKAVILAAHALLHEPQTVPQSHRLGELWRHGQSLVERTGQVSRDEDPTVFEAVTDAIAEWEEIDLTSTAFRYPETKDGAASFSVGAGGEMPERISIRNVADRVDDLDAFLRGIHDHLHYIMDIENEMAEAYRFE
jgi:hypothetical protein